MKKPDLQSMTEDDRLDRVLEEVALGVELEEILEELIPEDNPWWDGEGAFDLDETETETAPIMLTWKNRLSSMLDRMSDWVLVAERYLDIRHGDVGLMKGARAATLADPAGKTMSTSHFRRWRQGDISLILSVEKTKPFTVTLSIEEGPVVKLSRMSWVDKDSIGADPLRTPVLNNFQVTPTSDKRTFTVQAKPGDVIRRLTAIETAEKSGTSVARLLLPFVEWD